MFKIIKDSEFEVDNDNPANYIQKITEGIRNRKLGSPISFHYDGRMGKGLLNYLIEKLSLCKKNIFIPGSKIHNFRDFMDFPADLPSSPRRPPIKHPALSKTLLVSDLILKKDLLLHFPFHSFDTIIDLLREAATDKDVKVIKITAYRLAENSKICNALINAVRAGKKVEVVLELMASFDEALNLMWKQKLEEEGVIVYSGVPNYKVHAKICVIKKQVGQKIIEYGFIGTGNLNEKTASLYTDHFLLTSRPDIMADINRIFKVLENPEKNWKQIEKCKVLLVSPVNMRESLFKKIDREIESAKAGLPAKIIIIINSLSDDQLISKLYEASDAGVEIKMIVRGICCAMIDSKRIQAISILDEYLEHSRIWLFHNRGDDEIYISSCDWEGRNLDKRIEVATPIRDLASKNELIDIITLKLSDNFKARLQDSSLSNRYFANGKKQVRSQAAIKKYLSQKRYDP
jgi:polyphosphate kinase